MAIFCILGSYLSGQSHIFIHCVGCHFLDSVTCHLRHSCFKFNQVHFINVYLLFPGLLMPKQNMSPMSLWGPPQLAASLPSAPLAQGAHTPVLQDSCWPWPPGRLLFPPYLIVTGSPGCWQGSADAPAGLQGDPPTGERTGMVSAVGPGSGVARSLWSLGASGPPGEGQHLLAPVLASGA